MSQAHQRDTIIGSPTSQHPPIAKLPTEVLTKIFRAYVESYPEALNERVVDLCLVGKYWNAVANNTPQLWTNINLFFPFTDDNLAAMRKRVYASKLQSLDVFIDFYDPNSEGGDNDPTKLHRQAAWVQAVMTVLKDTEGRWKSIRVASNDWAPFYKLIEDWTFTYLPSLESITMKRDDPMDGMWSVSFRDPLLAGPMTLFGPNPVLPKLRHVSLCSVHVDWNDASVGFQNLRKLEIKNQTYDVGASFEQFAALLSSSPRLEYLDVSGFCPEHHTGPAPAGGIHLVPVVHLPALKEFVFGWKDPEDQFLEMFQIGSSLENLVLRDTESGLGHWEDQETGGRHWKHQSDEIFETLTSLGPAAPGGSDDTPPGPFISMRGVKRLEIGCTEAACFSLVPFLKTLTGLENLWLEDVDKGVLDGVTSVWDGSTTGRQPLEELDVRWTWQKEIPSFVEASIPGLKRASTNFSARAGD